MLCLAMEMSRLMTLRAKRDQFSIRAPYDLSVFHHKINFPESLDVREGILPAWQRCPLRTRGDCATDAVKAQEFSGIRGHAPEDFSRRDSRFAPDREIVEHQIRPRSVGHIDHGIGAECQLHSDAARAL